MYTRSEVNRPADYYHVGDKIISAAECTVSTDTGEGGQVDVVKLTPRSMEVLQYLCSNPNRVITFHEIINEIWPTAVASDHAVHKAIAEIRAAIGDRASRPAYIKTIPKRGYMFIANIDKIEFSEKDVAKNNAVIKPLNDLGVLLIWLAVIVPLFIVVLLFI